jgi:hypothetical protein
MSTSVSAMDRSPGEAIMAGFSLVAADNAALGPTLRGAARKAAEEFVASIEAVPDHGRERQYLNELRMAAVSFAAGLTRRQHERAQRIAAAEEERELNIRRIVQTQRLGGILRGGLQLLALGGFTYAFVSAAFSIRMMRGETVGLHREYAALATALASTLLGSFFKAWYTNLRINQVDKRYKKALREAKDIYHAEAVQEYEYAAQEANLAWTKFTGKPPAITDAFRVLIVGLLAGDRDLEAVQAKSAAKIEEEMEGLQDPMDQSLESVEGER